MRGSPYKNLAKRILLGSLLTFQDNFKSWFTSSSMAEVMSHSEFGFLILSWVGWIHSCTEIMLLPLWIIAQSPRQIGSFSGFFGRLQVLVSPWLHDGDDDSLQFWPCGPRLSWLDPFMHGKNVVAIVDRRTITTANWVVFWIFWEGFKSWFTSSSMAEAMPHSEFAFLVLSWVRWIHSCTEIMLLPCDDHCRMTMAKRVIFVVFGPASSLGQPLAP